MTVRSHSEHATGVQFLRFTKNGDTVYANDETKDCFNIATQQGQRASTNYIEQSIAQDRPAYAVALYYTQSGELVKPVFYDHGTKAVFDSEQYPDFLQRYFKPTPAV